MTLNKLPNFKYIHSSTSEVLDVLLHGSGQGMNSSLMVKLLNASEAQGDSVVSISFPFFDRGEEHSSGPELLEEIEAVKQVLQYCHADEFKKVRLIGKSLGGIVAGYFLGTLATEEKYRYEVVIFGYVAGSEKLQDFPGKITIVQGEKDKFGNIEIVKEDLKKALSQDITYFEVNNADHSYRDNQTKEPIYEDKAIGYYFEGLKELKR